MVEESSSEFSCPKYVLQPLLSASNSSSSREALDILIKASRTDVGRAELASRNVLPTVMKLVESLRRSSSREYLMQSMKLLRNICAGEIAYQNSFLERNGIDIVLLVLRYTNKALPDIALIRTPR